MQELIPTVPLPFLNFCFDCLRFGILPSQPIEEGLSAYPFNPFRLVFAVSLSNLSLAGASSRLRAVQWVLKNDSDGYKSLLKYRVYELIFDLRTYRY